MCQQVRWMKNREWVHKRERTAGNWPLFKKKRRGEKRERNLYLQANKHIQPHFEICATSPWTQIRGKSYAGSGFQRRERHPLSIFWRRCGCIYQRLQGQADSGVASVARAPAREALQHSVTLLAPPPPHDDISTRWLFWIMRPSGRVRRERGGKKAHFLGVCVRPETTTCFHQRLLPLMQNDVQGNRGTIKLAHCSCSPYHSHFSLFGVERHVSPPHWPPSSPN